ncbi:MAG: FeoA family protein [Dethiobacteria bacterium]|nr:FeoA family protein [Dethiobacteria bacterium]
MELAVTNRAFKNRLLDSEQKSLGHHPNLTEAAINVPYIIKGVDTVDINMKEFLFTLGCYEGEIVTVISVLAENYVINVKDARYSIDEDLARAVLV